MSSLEFRLISLFLISKHSNAKTKQRKISWSICVIREKKNMKKISNKTENIEDIFIRIYLFAKNNSKWLLKVRKAVNWRKTDVLFGFVFETCAICMEFSLTHFPATDYDSISISFSFFLYVTETCKYFPPFSKCNYSLQICFLSKTSLVDWIKQMITLLCFFSLCFYLHRLFNQTNESCLEQIL